MWEAGGLPPFNLRSAVRLDGAKHTRRGHGFASNSALPPADQAAHRWHHRKPRLYWNRCDTCTDVSPKGSDGLPSNLLLPGHCVRFLLSFPNGLQATQKRLLHVV